MSSDEVPVVRGMQRASWQRRQDLPRGRDEPRLTFMGGHGAFVFMGKAIGKGKRLWGRRLRLIASRL